MTTSDKPDTDQTPGIRDLDQNEIDSTSGGAATRTTGWVDPDTQPVQSPKGSWVDPDGQPVQNPKTPGWTDPDPHPIR